MPQIIPITTYVPETENDRGFSPVFTGDGTLLLFSDGNAGLATDFQFGVVTEDGAAFADPIPVVPGRLGTTLPTNSQIATTYSDPNSGTDPDVRDFLVMHQVSDDGIEVQFQISLTEVAPFTDIFVATDGSVYLLDTFKEDGPTGTVLSETGEVLEEGAQFDFDQPNLGIENLIIDQGYGPSEYVNGQPFFDAVSDDIDIAENYMPRSTWADVLPDGSRSIDYYEVVEPGNPPTVEIGRIVFSAEEFETIQAAQPEVEVIEDTPITDDVFQGDADDNEFFAQSGDDTLIGHGGDDYLESWLGDDVLRGGNGSDALYGWSGNDTLYGGQGNDHELYGWDGNDKVFGGKGQDDLYGGEGRDRLFGGKGDDYLSGGNGRDKIVGGDGDDGVEGSHGRDSVFGGRGNDYLEGGHGRDLIRGGKGHDTIDGGTGADRLFGGKGDDEIIGGLGDDKLFGKGGHDNLYAQAGNNTLSGGSGDNSFSDGSGDDLIQSTGGFDDIYLGGGNNTIVADADKTLINVAHDTTGTGGFSDGVTEVENFDIGQDEIWVDVVGSTGEANDPDFKEFLTGEISIDGEDAVLLLGDGRSLKLIDVVDDESVTAEDLVNDIFFDL